MSIGEMTPFFDMILIIRVDNYKSKLIYILDLHTHGRKISTTSSRPVTIVFTQVFNAIT